MITRSLLGLIRLYQLTLSSALGGHCRFHPTCSEYAHQSVAQHGALRGVWLSARRILRCHPFSQGGHDPVPTVHE